MGLSVEITRRRERSWIIALTGRLDSNTYALLEEKLASVLEEPLELVTFDMRNLEYINSMGLRTIFKARQTIKAQNGNVVLSGLQPQVMRVFELAHNLFHIPIFESMEETDRFFDTVLEMEAENKTAPNTSP